MLTGKYVNDWLLKETTVHLTTEHLCITKWRLKFADKLALHTDTENWSPDISADQVEHLDKEISPAHITGQVQYCYLLVANSQW